MSMCALPNSESACERRLLLAVLINLLERAVLVLDQAIEAVAGVTPVQQRVLEARRAVAVRVNAEPSGLK